jgi:hypothetical protein
VKLFTVQDIMNLNPCEAYSKKSITKLFDGRKRVSLTSMLRFGIPCTDRIWVVARLMPVDKAVEFAKWCADSVKHLDYADATYAAEVATYAAAAAAYAADHAADADAADAYADDAYVAAVAAARAADVAADAAAVAAARADDARADTRKTQVNKLKELIKESTTCCN